MRFANITGDIANPSFCQISQLYTVPLSSGGSRNFYSIFNFRRVSSPAGGTLASILAAFRADLNVAWAACLPTVAVGQKSVGRFLDVPWSSPSSGVTAFSNGTVTGDRLPTYGSVSMQFKTGVRGKNYRGGKRFGPVAESHTTLDELNATGETAWVALRDILSNPYQIIDSVGATWHMIVLSTDLSDLTSDPCVFTGADVTTVVLNDTLGTMRRRKERPQVAV